MRDQVANCFSRASVEVSIEGGAVVISKMSQWVEVSAKKDESIKGYGVFLSILGGIAEDAVFEVCVVNKPESRINSTHGSEGSEVGIFHTKWS